MSVDPSTSGTLDFKQASKVTFIGSSSNTVIDTVTGSFGIGVDVNGPSSNLHVVGNTRLEGDINMLHTSNNAAIKLNSNVVTEFPRSKKLIKYPRVALTGSTSGGYTAQTSSINVSTQDAWYAFDNSEPGDNTSRWRTASPRYTNSGATPPNEYLFTGSEAGDWISIQLPEKMKLVYYTMTGIHTHTPQEGVIYGYDSDTSTWHKVSTFYFDTTSYPVNNTPLFSPEFHVGESVGMYSKYAMIVTKTNGSDAPSLYEWKLYGLPEYDPDAAGVDVKVTSYPNVPNTDWLEVYYDAKDLEDNSTTVNDLKPVGTAINGTVAGNTSVTDGAFTFDGSGDYIVSGNTSLSGTPTITYSVWFKTNSINDSGSNSIVMIGYSGNTNSLGFRIEDGGTYRFYVYGGSTAESQTTDITATLGNWVHATITFNSGTGQELYLNGNHVRSTSSTTTVLSLAANSKVILGNYLDSSGALAGTASYDGSIANFRLFNRALTSDEIYQLYAYQKEYFGHGDLGMTLKAGRLGIGTSEPRAALDVQGPVRIYDTELTNPVYAEFSSNYSSAGFSDEQISNWRDPSNNILDFNVVTQQSSHNAFDADSAVGVRGSFTVPVEGLYVIYYAALVNRISTSSHIYVHVNGSNANGTGINSHQNRNTVGSMWTTLTIQRVLRLNRGDKVQCYITGGFYTMNHYSFGSIYQIGA